MRLGRTDNNLDGGGPWDEAAVGDRLPAEMTLRDWFAGKALQAVVSLMGAVSVDVDPDQARASAAREAYALADAMLEASLGPLVRPQEGP